MAAPETQQYFISECSAYTQEREVYVQKPRNNLVLHRLSKPRIPYSAYPGLFRVCGQVQGHRVSGTLLERVHRPDSLEENNENERDFAVLKTLHNLCHRL